MMLSRLTALCSETCMRNSRHPYNPQAHTPCDCGQHFTPAIFVDFLSPKPQDRTIADVSCQICTMQADLTIRRTYSVKVNSARKFAWTRELPPAIGEHTVRQSETLINIVVFSLQLMTVIVIPVSPRYWSGSLLPQLVEDRR